MGAAFRKKNDRICRAGTGRVRWTKKTERRQRFVMSGCGQELRLSRQPPEVEEEENIEQGYCEWIKEKLKKIHGFVRRRLQLYSTTAVFNQWSSSRESGCGCSSHDASKEGAQNFNRIGKVHTQLRIGSTTSFTGSNVHPEKNARWSTCDALRSTKEDSRRNEDFKIPVLTSKDSRKKTS